MGSGGQASSLGASSFGVDNIPRIMLSFQVIRDISVICDNLSTKRTLYN